MTTNPYQAPEIAHGDRRKPRKVWWWLWPPIITAMAGAVDVALFVIIPLLTPPSGSPGTLTVSVLMIVSLLLMLPGLPLFLALETTGLIPMGDDDDFVRGIWAICCNVVSWGILSCIVSLLFARPKPSETGNGN